MFLTQVFECKNANFIKHLEGKLNIKQIIIATIAHQKEQQ